MYGLCHVSGVWLAHADLALEGQIYPPLYDGVFYGGTRYMPVGIFMSALATSLFGPLLGAKLVAWVTTLGLLVAVGWGLRKLDFGRAETLVVLG